MNNPLKKIKSARESRKVTFGEQLDLVFKKAVAEAVEKHRLAGNSIPVFRSGQIILIPPEQIEPLVPNKQKAGRISFAILRIRRSRKKARGKTNRLIVAVRRFASRS